jgi:hypothetical protein
MEGRGGVTTEKEKEGIKLGSFREGEREPCRDESGVRCGVVWICLLELVG